ncbi:MAG: N-acetylmuramoyl-L-alanine amidase [Actinobacteria bacterium]|nr:N-acetylmuramoyl-L-alanine amidase [Actinomycetota bacterium]
MSNQPDALYRLGDKGVAVRSIRALLQATGDLAPSTIGDSDVYDRELARAVRAFQQRRGLIVDGVFGPHTQVALDGARWKLGDRLLSYVPGHLLQGDDVAELQERLLSLGFTPDRVDGVFGTNTDQAVRRFQGGVGLAVDGRVGPETLRAFTALARSVSGGSPHTLREQELVRRSGHRLIGRVVVLDPGHGGDDTGTAAHDLIESEVMLDLARRIEGRLSAIGVTVLFTRSATTGPEDLSRARMANQAGADIMLSLHCDSTDQPQAGGVATFFYGLERFGAWSAVGEHLADLIQREIVARTGLTDCRSHPRGWVLLQRTQMPTVRIEAGYLSHQEDAARLADPAFLDTLAEAIVIALQRMYLGEDDTNATGVLRLGDLSAYNAKQRASSE